MLTLAIQTATDPAQVALLTDGTVVAERTICDRLAVCRLLAPEIGRALGEAGHVAADVGLVAVCVGPGSFTGVRIGVAAAKAFAHAHTRPLAAVDSLRALASEAATGCVVACVSAGRERVFCGAYSGRGEVVIRGPQMVSLAEVKAWLSLACAGVPSGTGCTAIGQLPPHLTAVATELGCSVEDRTVTAAAVGRIGISLVRAGEGSDVLSLAPLYLRLSSPEERAAALDTPSVGGRS